MLRTEHWDVVHAFGTALEGWFVLTLRRHVAAFADLTDDETLELGPLIKRVSSAMRAVLGCGRTYFALFAEDPAHAHVHVHVIPRFDDQPVELRGPHVFPVLGRGAHESVPIERMDELALALREELVNET